MRRLALICTLLTATAAAADSVTIRLKDRDSIGIIAAEYYGDRKHASFIVLESKLPPNKPVRPGARLRVPVAREIITAPGDTFATLAEAHLGDAKRESWLAQWNGLPADQPPAAGTPLLVPFVVSYTSAGNETLGKVAATYLGSASHAELLRRYNFLDATELDKGQQVLVPAFNVRLQPSKLRPLDEKAKARKELLRTTTARAVEVLPRARFAWRTGDFAAVRELLGELDLDYVPQATAVEAGVLLGSAHVAFDDRAAAQTAFERVLRRKPGHVLRAAEHSPKVREAWKQAGGGQP